MTNLLTVLPDLDIAPFAHILPSLERACVSTADLLTLDALDVAKQAQVPPAEVRKLTEKLLAGLHKDVLAPKRYGAVNERGREGEFLRNLFPSRKLSTLDDQLDAALGGGIAAGYLTEIVGESAVGKTQLLLTLLLSVQLSNPGDAEQLLPRRSALYISTEAALQTSRLVQILETNPKFADLTPSQRPSLNRIHSTHIYDLEAQEHILRFQVPAAVEKQGIGLVVIDSIAANYRAEEGKGRRGADFLSERSEQLMQIGTLLRELARRFNIAVVVANQVGDRFMPMSEPSGSFAPQQLTQSTQGTRPASSPHSSSLGKSGQAAASQSDLPPAPLLSTDDPLSLVHQQRFFTGWGDDPFITSNLKTPVLGLTWTNQMAARIALIKDPMYEDKAYAPGEERNLIAWRREFKIVFSAWCSESRLNYEIWEGGVRAAHKQDLVDKEA